MTNPRSTTTDRTRQIHLPFSVVTKPTGAACNLDCSYCFFLSKELLYESARQTMDEKTLNTYVQEFLAAQPDGEVTMLWQGGEPTMRGIDFFRRAVELAKKHARPGQHVQHALQTNATLIDPTWAAFLKEENFLVGVSIDGPPGMHNAYRVNRAARGTYDQVLRGYRHLKDAGVDINILCTVHAANQDHPIEVYRHFRDDLGATFMQFIPIVERVEAHNLATAEEGWRGEGLLYTQTGDAVTSRSVDPAAYGRFLSAIFDEWVTRDVGEVFVQDFDSALSAFFNRASVCVHAPECGYNFAMEFNGDVYACDHWVEPDYLLGNIADTSFPELARSERMREFGLKKNRQLTQQCRTCPVLKLCWGGCPKDRFITSKNGEAGHNYLCDGYYSFYRHILPDMTRMARLIAAGKPAALVMEQPQP